MIRLFLLLAIAIVSAGGVEAQSPQYDAEMKTGTLENGRLWLTLPNIVRTFYVDGFITGLQAGLGIGGGMAAINRTMPYGFKLGDVVEEIEKVYREKENVRVPIVKTIMLVLQKLRGEFTPADFQAQLKLARLSSQER